LSQILIYVNFGRALFDYKHEHANDQ